MAFPQTRHTLIQRLATGGNNDDWQDFMADYWGPVCRFALRRGNHKLAEAEDVAAGTFEVVLRNDLLERWSSSKRAKLRTLLCNVVCRVQANQFRTDRRKRLFEKEFADELLQAVTTEATTEQDEKFLAAWVEDLLQNVLLQLAKQYHGEGKGDYFRVLYGRLCERSPIAEVAAALEISTSAVDNYYRHVRSRLGESLEAAVRSQVYRYCPAAEAEAEFQAEWGKLATYLSEHGGLEKAVGRAHDLLEARQLQANKPQRIRDTLTKIHSAPTTKERARDGTDNTNE